MQNEDQSWFQDQLRSRWDKLSHSKLDVTDASSIKAEIAQKYGYEAEKADYEYEQFMNELAGRDERAAKMQEKLGEEQNRGPLSQRLDT